MTRTSEAIAREPSARAIGIVYLLYFLTSVFGAFLVRGLVVPDAAATANIVAHENLYRAGFAFDLLGNVLYIVLAALFYWFFQAVNRDVSLIAAFCSLTGCTVQIMGELLRIMPLVLLRNARLATVYTPAQLQGAVLLSLTLQTEIIRIAVVLFAVFDLLIGYLILRSTFVPFVIGLCMMVAGLGWLTILWPPLAVALHGVLLPLGGLAELLLMLWLLVKGGRPRAPLLDEKT
jgi:uncharacterized protein DUF4386